MSTAHFNIQRPCILRILFAHGVLYGSHNKQANISLNNIIQFIFKIEMQYVFCEVANVFFLFQNSMLQRDNLFECLIYIQV
jgi:hypothetical protein